MRAQIWNVITLTVILVTLTPIAVANSEPPAGATQVRETDGATMVYVPSGEFLMGSSAMEGKDDEWPQHIVFLDGFWIDRTEVTNRQFGKFVTATNYRTDAENEGRSEVWMGDTPYARTVNGADWRHPEGPDSSLAGCEDCPVVHVSWNDAQAYCQWAGGRLPTEAEWEKAACGVDGRRYSWGNEQPSCQYIVMQDSSGVSCGQGRKPWPVGSKPEGASPYGALDMLGNVWEMVADRYDNGYYAYSPASNPQGADFGNLSETRGGSWIEIEKRSVHHCTHRDNPHIKTFRANLAGFRCAMAAPTAGVPVEAASSGSKPASSVLFIGDSDVRFLDRYLPRLAASGNAPVNIESKAFASDEMWLGLYYMQGKYTMWLDMQGKYTLQDIKSGQWKFVVLQQDIDRSWQIAKTFCAYVGKFYKATTTAGAEIVIFLPWDNPATTSPTLKEITDVSTKCGNELGVKVAPVGLAFERAIGERSTLNLFFPNSTHVNVHGVYLTICVLYATLFDRNPVNLTYRMDDVAAWSLEYTRWGLEHESNWQISAEDAGFLQRIAWETVQDYQAKPE